MLCEGEKERVDKMFNVNEKSGRYELSWKGAGLLVGTLFVLSTIIPAVIEVL